IKTDQVMDNFKKDTRDRVVVDRNYEVGQRYRVLPGQVMIRNKLYVMTAEGTGAFRAPVNMVAIGDGARIEIPEGAQFRVSDRVLVSGRLASLIALPAPPPGAPDIQAIFANDGGLLVPASLRAGKVVPFTAFEVQPKNAQLLPIVQESVKTSAGYVNYDVIYHGNEVRKLESCTPPRASGVKAPPASAASAAPVVECGTAPHLDLSLLQYDRVNPDVVASGSRRFYPVRNNQLELPGLKITIHEATPASVVYEVTKDDNAYKKKP
ncbi:MAG: hypothetical protein IT563_19525, partial [Alphaproteobacteria bacterium]|nr:hypothetical protein [Alphaproteobacteria bacterium]